MQMLGNSKQDGKMIAYGEQAILVILWFYEK
jgi:hypothetical protein